MKKIILLVILILQFLFFSSCTKKIANPELIDEIYLDLKNELELSAKQEETTRVQLTKDIEAFRKSQPQTGEATLNRNKMSTTENLLSILQQQKKFFEIKIEQRKNFVNARYQESLTKNGRAWPDAKEIQEYKVKMKLQRDKFNWDSGNVPRGTPNKKENAKEKISEKKEH